MSGINLRQNKKNENSNMNMLINFQNLKKVINIK
jgi:hypothetical protein